MWGGVVDYTHYTGDDSYSSVSADAIVSQSSDTLDFMMENHHYELGNDDQVFWALTAMSAAEYSHPVPAGIEESRYITLCKNVFDDMVPRWNVSWCGGGLKWQIYESNRGYDYKSTIANGGFFQLAARLARFTGNTTHAEWADKAYNWLQDVGFLKPDTYEVLDGAGDAPDNCTKIDLHQWSYNAATMIYGSAVMANITGSEVWLARTEGLVAAASKKFFTPYPNATNIMFEQECETTGPCNTDQLSFKAYLSRWMGKAAKLVDSIAPTIDTLLKASALGAASSCSGESTNSTCGTKWYVGTWDGSKGVGQQMSALEVVLSLLASSAPAPGTAAGVSWP